MPRKSAILLALLLLPLEVCWSQDRDTKVRDDRREIEDDGSWIYNDLDAGRRIARKQEMPLLVVLRCIP